MKRDSRFILFSFVLSLVLLMGAYRFKQREAAHPLPVTPEAGYGEMLRMMKAKDSKGLSRIMNEGALQTLQAFQEGRVDNCDAYSYLRGKGIKPAVLRQPWGLWQQWARQMENRHYKSVPQDSVGHLCAIWSSESGIHVFWEQQGSGWVCIRIMV